MKISEPILIGYEFERINGKYFHININQGVQPPIFYINSISSNDYRIHQIRLTDEKITLKDFILNFKINQRCSRCYFATDDSNYIYISMDKSNSLERYENNGQKIISIHIPSPAGLIIRNNDIWIVNNSQLIILSPRLLYDQTLTYLIENQIELSLLSKSSRDFQNLLFMPFHLDVDNYGRIYIVGALVENLSQNNRQSTGHRQQLYILVDDQLGRPSVSCAEPWGMFGINVYHSKLKLRMLTTSNNYAFNFYSNS